MKGIHGLIVAIALGLAGAAANFYYLNTEAQKKDMVAFIGIKKGVIIGRGDRLTDDNLVKVEIPKNHVGNLGDYVFLWEERDWRQGQAGLADAGQQDRHRYGERPPPAQRLVEPPPKELELGKGRTGGIHRRAEKL